MNPDSPARAGDTDRQRSSGIFAERFGQGPELVMLHGWCMHSGVWREFAGRLSERYSVTLIDLPGHGRSGPLSDYSISSQVDALADAAPVRAHWLGWSLGALLGLGMAARHPSRVRSLTMIAGTPCFMARENWPGTSPGLLDRMGADLQRDFAGTVRRFVGLQTFGLEHARDLSRQIMNHLETRPAPDVAALQGGLQLLREQDLRPVLTTLDRPVAVLLGAHDRLVPQAQALPLQSLNPQIEMAEMAAAAHIPFLSHPQETAALIAGFLNRQGQDH